MWILRRIQYANQIAPKALLRKQKQPHISTNFTHSNSGMEKSVSFVPAPAFHARADRSESLLNTCRHEILNPEKRSDMAVGLAGSRNAAASQSPGLAALFAAYPGKGCDDAINPKWVASAFNPYRVDMQWNPLPRVERHNAPLNPGLCDEAPLGLSETHAVTAEPFRVMLPEAAVYSNAIISHRARMS